MLNNTGFLPDNPLSVREVRTRRPGSRGFTLIELLIVIAIILILIAIALPNFLEAQLRARVTKARGEIRSLGIAMESYYLDFQTYPSESEHDPHKRGRAEQGLFWLTSPIQYISTLPLDPFGPAGMEGELEFYEMGGAETANKHPGCTVCLATWAIFTQGPDGDSDITSDAPHMEPIPPDDVPTYTATNGTKSDGDIFLYGGDGFWIGVAMGGAHPGLYKKQNTTGQLDRGLLINGRFYLHRLPPPLE